MEGGGFYQADSHQILLSARLSAPTTLPAPAHSAARRGLARISHRVSSPVSVNRHCFTAVGNAALVTSAQLPMLPALWCCHRKSLQRVTILYFHSLFLSGGNFLLSLADWILLLACRKLVLWALRSTELEIQNFLFSSGYSKNLEDG